MKKTIILMVAVVILGGVFSKKAKAWEETISFSITSVSPAAFVYGVGGEITIKGSGFYNGLTVSVYPYKDYDMYEVDDTYLADVTVVDSETITAQFPDDMDGTWQYYDLDVNDEALHTYARLENAFIIGSYVTTDTPSISYSVSKSAKADIVLTVWGVILNKKDVAKVIINGKKIPITKIKRYSNATDIYIKVKYKKWEVGDYGLTLNVTKKVKRGYEQKNGDTKYKNFSRKEVFTYDNVLTITQ